MTRAKYEILAESYMGALALVDGLKKEFNSEVLRGLGFKPKVQHLKWSSPSGATVKIHKVGKIGWTVVADKSGDDVGLSRFDMTEEGEACAHAVFVMKTIKARESEPAAAEA